MMGNVAANLICPFLGTVAFAVLFNVPRKYYLAGGLTGTAGWLAYIFILNFSSAAIASFVGVCGSIYIQDADRADEVPDHGIPDIRYLSSGAGSRCLLYGLLPCDRPDRSGRGKRAGGSEDRLCDCPWHSICGFHSKRGLSGTVLEK